MVSTSPWSSVSLNCKLDDIDAGTNGQTDERINRYSVPHSWIEIKWANSIYFGYYWGAGLLPRRMAKCDSIVKSNWRKEKPNFSMEWLWDTLFEWPSWPFGTVAQDCNALGFNGNKFEFLVRIQSVFCDFLGENTVYCTNGQRLEKKIRYIG